MQLLFAGQSIKVETAAGVTTNNLNFYTEYDDKIRDMVTPGMSTGGFTNANVIAVAGPANSTQREITEMWFYNNDTVAATVIVTYVDIGGSIIVKKSTLNAGQTLMYSIFEGWSVS